MLFQAPDFVSDGAGTAGRMSAPVPRVECVYQRFRLVRRRDGLPERARRDSGALLVPAAAASAVPVCGNADHPRVRGSALCVRVQALSTPAALGPADAAQEPLVFRHGHRRREGGDLLTQ